MRFFHTGIFYSEWSQNPFVRGSFPNAKIGGKLGNLVFVGDATVPVHRVSNSLEKKTALEILQCIKGKCPAFWPNGQVVQEFFIHP